MSWTLFKGTVHQHRMPMVWFSVGLVLYSWMMAWFHPQIGGGEYAQLVESLPPEMLAIFGGTEVPFASLGGYFQTYYLGLMWMLIVVSALVLFSVKAFSGEIAAGTMEFVLAQPISRIRFAVTRIVVLAGYAILLAAASFVPIQVLGPLYDIELSPETLWTLFAFGVLFMLAAGGLAMLLSSIFREGGKPVAITSGVLVLLWIADLLSGVSRIAEFFDPVNLVGYWQPGTIINGEAVPAEAWWLYAIVATVMLAGSVFVFSRRDVA
ncbi:MAG: ABC transporter permease subunit [Coriobacteriia bacterium]